MHFLLTTLKVVYVLTTPIPKLLEDATVEAIRIKAKWENDDCICRGHILNGMSDSLFDVYTNVKSDKELWDSLESKYTAEDSSSKKFLVDAIAWWIDSGATTHVYKDRCWFKTYELVERRIYESQRDDHYDKVPSKILEPRKEEDPRTYDEAMQSQDAAFWKEAIDDEIGHIMENNTWFLSDLPPGCKPLGCKWIFKRKLKVDGTIGKFKARLEIQGFREKEGIDYFDTYAPVARITTIRLLLDLAFIHNLVIHQMDVKTTFLNGDLDEEVYMKQPEGFVMSGNEHKVCKLVKSLYGLKQAPRQWNQKFDEVVLSSGFHLNQSDKCVYSKFDDSGKGVIICLHVDDMLIFGTDQYQVDKTKKFLSSKFSMKDMREAGIIVGIKIKCENKRIVITQSHYIEKIFKKFNHEDCSPASKKQTCINGSTMESEFVALAATSKEAEWLRNLIYEIPIWPKPIASISI
nr:zinc finger, CCHC-type [Tanacetum cinerariifolium]